MALNPTTIAAFQNLRRELPAAADLLKLNLGADLQKWMHALDVKLLPKLAPDFPLVVAICGGGSAGKSTLFNSLVGQTISPTGGRAGLNRRVLAALQEHHLRLPHFLASLTHTFGAALQPLEDPQQLTTPGDPLYYAGSAAAPRNVVLLDTPDIDTGARGAYANRDLAGRSLETADAFIYIFTNATYNNRDNTDFIARLLTGMGTRPSFLVYRVYPSFSDAEVREHAQTVAVNLYGKDYQNHVLGIFRADDDNRVAAGQTTMTLRAIDGRPADLRTALTGLDAAKLRRHLLQSMMVDAVGQGRRMHQLLQESQLQLQEYIAALENAQRLGVQQALSHFPTDRVLRRFADIWVSTDPTHIKIMRGTGLVVEWPMKLVVGTVRLMRSTNPPPPPIKKGDPSGQVEIDLLQAANVLYQQTVDHHLQTGYGTIEAHAVAAAAQDSLKQKDWKQTLTYIQDRKEVILSWSVQLEKDLKALARELRSRMGVMDQIRQTFSAMLNVIPATAAVTYILHTGDPAGALGIKVKLTGLLGLNDLYALIAIPATAGMKKADRLQLEQMLAPVARTWLAHKMLAVQQLFEAQITGDVLSAARSSHSQAADLLESIARSLAALKKEIRA